MPFLSEGTTPVKINTQRKTLLQVLIGLRELAENLIPGITLSSPSFYTEGSTPARLDTEHKITQKILGVLKDINAAVIGLGGMASQPLYGVGSPEGVVVGTQKGQIYIDTQADVPYHFDGVVGQNTGWI